VRYFSYIRIIIRQLKVNVITFEMNQINLNIKFLSFKHSQRKNSFGSDVIKNSKFYIVPHSRVKKVVSCTAHICEYNSVSFTKYLEDPKRV